MKKKKNNSTSTKNRPVRNILKLDDEKEIVDQATSSNQKRPVKNILTLEEEPKMASTSARKRPVRNILKLDDGEEKNQENTYSLHPITDKKKCAFPRTIQQNNINRNEKKIICG